MIFFQIGLASIFVVICSLIMVKLSGKFAYDNQPYILAFCFFFFIVGVCGIIATPFLSFKHYQAKHKALIINKEFGTKYTTKDVFYAEDVIEEIRQMNRHRIELNGNILNNKGE